MLTNRGEKDFTVTLYIGAKHSEVYMVNTLCINQMNTTLMPTNAH
jgi:hypothetical protein